MKYPEMRAELIETLKCLSDKEYQQQVWVEQNYPEGVHEDNLDYAVHFIYDDSGLADKPERLIGCILHDENESVLVKNVIQALDEVFDALGTERTDEEYISANGWEKVLSAAAVAYKQLQQNQTAENSSSSSGKQL